MNEFFVSCVFKLALAYIAGFALGFERKLRQQVVGMRTLILICGSTAMLSILSQWIGINAERADSARIAAGVVSGIGFLGAGVIIKNGLNIKGLTSAAVIWADATIGLCIGEGLYLPSFVLLVFFIVSLLSLEKIEERWFPAGRTKSLNLIFNTCDFDMEKLRSVIYKNGFVITDVNITQTLHPQQTVIHYSVRAPKINDYSKFVDALNAVAPLAEFSISG